MSNRNHQELSRQIVQFLQALRGGVQNQRLHQPHICIAEKEAADSIAKFLQLLAAELLLATAEETK